MPAADETVAGDGNGDGSPRSALQAAITARMNRASQPPNGNPAVVLESQAAEEISALTSLLREDDRDLDSRFLLGWLHLRRHLALDGDQAQDELVKALRFFMTVFLGVGGEHIPGPALSYIVPAAADMLMRERPDAALDVNQLSQRARIWGYVWPAVPASDPRRIGYAVLYALDLHDRYRLTGDRADLDLRVAVLADAVRAGSREYDGFSLAQSSLGLALQLRYSAFGQTADLDWAIENFSAALADPDREERHHLASMLGGALRLRSERAGRRDDLERAIVLLRDALASCPESDHLSGTISEELGIALVLRFDWTGDISDLDSGIAGLWAAEKQDSANPARASHIRGALVTGLSRRYAVTGDQADLDDSISLGQQAVDESPAVNADLGTFLASLGNALMGRFQRTGRREDLDQAIANLERSAQVTGMGQPTRAVNLASLGRALSARKADGDLDLAVTCLREAVEFASGNDADKAIFLSNLAGVTREQGDLDATVRYLQDAIQITPGDHPDLTTYRLGLGNALTERHRRTGAPGDLSGSARQFELAARNWTGAPVQRIWAARMASQAIASADPGQAASLLELGVSLLPRVIPRQLSREDQQRAIGAFEGLAADAAALVLSDPARSPKEQAEQALRLLEAGRAVMLSQALQTRETDLADLESAHPALAERFVRLREAVNRPLGAAAGAAAPVTGSPGGGPGTRDRRDLAVEFDRLIDEIRALPGFAEFASLPSPSELVGQAKFGSLVVFNVSRYRSDALLVTGQGVSCLPLPGLGYDNVIDAVNVFHRALDNSVSMASPGGPQAAERVIKGVLGWLWDNAVGPVLGALGHLDGAPQAGPAEDWPRIWWVPGGMLDLLPVHAAGRYGGSIESSPDAAINRVVSSYTPIIATLRQARGNPPVNPVVDGEQVLVVAMPVTPGIGSPLIAVSEEVDAIAGRLPGAVIFAEPDPDAAEAVTGAGDDEAPAPRLPTLRAVTEMLPRVSVSHFACHGISDSDNPSHSRLLLHDHATDPLTVSAVSSLRLGHARLAYLSACGSALSTNQALLDESIHLTTGFQLAGYDQVIGTRWVINDMIAARVAAEVYAGLAGPGGAGIDTSRGARALHDAVRSVLRASPALLDRPSLWAAYVHVGV
jgi:tetratricopeptide (TPR) repeat protein